MNMKNFNFWSKIPQNIDEARKNLFIMETSVNRMKYMMDLG